MCEMTYSATFPFRAYAEASRDLTLGEGGAFAVIINHVLAGHPLPDDAVFVSSVMNASQIKWCAIKARLLMLKKIRIEDGFILPNIDIGEVSE
jgi:hypothetical protein